MTTDPNQALRYAKKVSSALILVVQVVVVINGVGVAGLAWTAWFLKLKDPGHWAREEPSDSGFLVFWLVISLGSFGNFEREEWKDYGG